jgi:ABC-type sulfate transport system permease component
MSPPNASSTAVSYRDVLIIGTLIVVVCFFTLTPAMYLVFQALQWAWAIRLVEEAFFPSLLLSVVAGLLAYKRAQARQAWLERDEPDASR